MIPEWSTNGDLPPGVHFATWQELEDRLTFNPRRHRMPAGFRQACEELRKAGCRLVYLDGSDARLDPVFWDFSRGRAAHKQRFLGELFPAQLPEGAAGRAFVDFFQVNKMSGEPKGILAIRLGRSRRK
jgi:hypothetical protein